MALSISIFVKWELIINEPIPVWILVWWTLVDVISEKVEFHLSITIQSPYSSHPSMECSLKFWKSESGLFSVLISDGWHPDPSGLPQLFGWNSQVRWETTRDEKRLFENCEPCKLKQTSYLKIFRWRKSQVYLQMACVVKSASPTGHWPLSSKRQ